MIFKPFTILTLNTEKNQWGKRTFESFQEWYVFVKSCWKFPGQYEFKNTDLWIQPARKFQKTKKYTDYHPKSKEYKEFWLLERRKCIQGVIVDDYWISPDLYWFWNYTPIFDKVKATTDFPDIWDSHYHYDLYLQLSWLEDLDGACVKSRQKGISLYHVSRLARKLWFGDRATLKIIGYEEEYVLGEWAILEGYRDFLNENTGWYRSFSPEEKLNWEQKIQTVEGIVNKVKKTKGNKSKIKGATTKKNYTKAVGGCHKAGDKIITTEGIKNVEDIKVGDFVFGEDGKPKKVLRLFSGEDDLFRVNQKYGQDYYVNSNHILHLHSNNKLFPAEKNVKVVEYLKEPNYLKKIYHGVKLTTPLQTDRPIQIDPYLLGLWLGDGYRSSLTFIVNRTKDPEIIDYFKQLPLESGLSVNFYKKEEDRYNDEMFKVSITGRGYGVSNSLLDSFKFYNLIKNKHIPEDYLWTSPANRLELLAGLIDTDGTYIKKRQVYEISSKNLDFIKQIQSLCISLGIYTSYRLTTSKAHTTEKHSIKETQSYIIRLSPPENVVIPCKIKRKRSNIIRKKDMGGTPITIEPVGYGRYYGFECEDHLYVLADGTITHNSALEIYATEAGIYRNLKKVKGYVDPNIKMGSVKTGMFVAAGAVGELQDAEDLQEFILNPKAHGIKSVKDVFSGSKEDIGFFFPDEWNYIYKDPDSGLVVKCYDIHGNSNLEQALEFLKTEELKQKEKDEQSYKLWKSQHPRTIQDAFDYRDNNPFSVELIKKQQLKVLQSKDIIVSLHKDSGKKVYHKFSDDVPVYTINPDPKKDNRGAVIIYEFPIENPPFGLYVAGIDPVWNLETSTSKSLMAITIYMSTHERNGKIIPGYPVASYVGRHKRATDTYQICLDLIRFYNAKAAVESNVKDFIEWMIRQGESRLLFRRRELTAITEMMPQSTIRDEIGVRMEGEFKKRCIEKAILYVDQPIADEFDLETGEQRTVYGVNRIKDRRLLSEMLRWKPDLNTDSLVSFMLALIASESYQNMHIIKEVKDGYYQKPQTKNPTRLPSQFSMTIKQTQKKLKSPFSKYK